MRAYEFIRNLNENEYSGSTVVNAIITEEVVASIDTIGKKASALKTFNDVFGHLELPPKPDGTPSSVEYELRNVDWSGSVGVFDDNGYCLAVLAMRDYSLMDYLESKPDSNFSEIVNDREIRNMHNAQGEALYADEQLSNNYKMRMFLAIANKYRKSYDYLWGLAHVDLNNMGFWRKHSIPLGIHGEENSWVFVLPLNQRAKQAFSKFNK